jgi:hypothetical protein
LTPPLNLPAPGRRQCVYGALRGLARTCVFAKQSLGPIHCDPAERRARGSVPTGASLLPKLRDHYAEFLDPVSLVHLRLLASPTCVGLRYGRPPTSARGFSRVSTPEDSGSPKLLPRTRVSAARATYALGRPSTWPLPLRSTVPTGFNDRKTGPES